MKNSKRWPLFALPTLVLLSWACLPLIRGSETLFLRDIFLTHLPMRHAVGEALRNGQLPWMDPYRAEGQPLLGNLNAAPLYPDQLLSLVAQDLWAANAHFWLHLLLAVPAAYGLGRAFRLSRRASWAAGTLWATSGFFLSQLNFYNLVAGAALAPAFVAASIFALRAEHRPWSELSAALLWCLLLLAGDPMSALQALLLAAGGVLLVSREEAEPAQRFRRWLPLGLALVAGTLLALPQLVEFLHVLPGSFRGAYGISREAASATSWEPRQSLDLLLPFPWGRPDLLGAGSFWGHRLFEGHPPLMISLYPGLLGLALLAAAGRPRHSAAWWGLGALGLGLFLALGRHNPLTAWIWGLGGMRYPAKLWLMASLGACLWAAFGFERALVAEDPGARRRLLFTLLGLAAAFLLVWIGFELASGGVERALAGWMGPNRSALAGAERQRLARDLLLSLGSALVSAGLVFAARRRAVPAAAGLLAFHAASQLFLLQPLFVSDAALPYRLRPTLAEKLPAGAVLAHGGYDKLFGRQELARADYPAPEARWITRRAFAELAPPAGPFFGLHYAFNPSPEGLGALASTLANQVVAGSSDPKRMSLARASGVSHLLLPRPLEPEAAAGTTLLAETEGFGNKLYLYELAGSLGEAQLLGTVVSGADFDQILAHILDPTFDPTREVVVEGPGSQTRSGPSGTAALELDQPARVAARVNSSAGGVLVLRRTFHPIYRAFVDGAEVPAQRVNLHLLGVTVPPGEHRVEVEVDRRPFQRALGGTFAGLLLVGALVALARRSSPTPAAG
ncbi:MAG: hypothetical protein U0002_01015 [Thermoanaerobaculia bacterium]